MDTPFFSIIIPTYNRATFIGKSINSVLGQDFSDWELIVVDDGSKDGTADVVRSIVDERVKYIFQENKERASARNAGVALSNGKYVTFLDSDDIFYANHLTTAVEIVKKHSEPEIFHLGYELTDLSSRRSSKIDFLPSIGNDELVYGNHLSCQGVFLRSDIACENQFNPDRELSGSEDYELWLRLASRYPIYCDNRITSAIIQHDDRSVVSTNPERLIKRIALLEKYLAEDQMFMTKFGDKLGIIRSNLQLYISLHLALMKNHRLMAIKHLVRALKISPSALNQRTFYATLKHII